VDTDAAVFPESSGPRVLQTPREALATYTGAMSEKNEKGLPSASESTDSVDSHHYGTGEVLAIGADSSFYRPIEKYEGIHRWDPKFLWTEEEEKRLIRRVSGMLGRAVEPASALYSPFSGMNATDR
jgi:hypothetical protein